MSMAGMSRRDRTILAVVVVVLMYGIAALIWFSGREAAWAKSRKAYENAKKTLAKENKLISEKAAWQKKSEEISLKMPMAAEDESTETRWQRLLEKIAAANKVEIKGEQPKPEEEHGGVWEMPIEVRVEECLSRIVKFLYDLENAEGGMFDVRDLDISSRTNGFLTVKFTLTSANMKGPAK